MNSIAEAEGREAEAAAKKKKQSSGSKVTADDDDCYDNFVS